MEDATDLTRAEQLTRAEHQVAELRRLTEAAAAQLAGLEAQVAEVEAKVAEVEAKVQGAERGRA